MDDHELRRHVRQLVQEEIASSSSATSQSRLPVHTLINRTRQMIQNSAASACSHLNSPSRNITGHRDRLSFGPSGKKRKLSKKTVTHELQVLNKPPDINEDVEYPLEEKNVLIKEVLLDLHNLMSETEIRQSIVDACQNKLPLLKPTDFEFIKRVKGKVCIPTVADNFSWDYPQVKKIAGQGKIYVQLTKEMGCHSDSDSDFELQLPSLFSPTHLPEKSLLPGIPCGSSLEKPKEPSGSSLEDVISLEVPSSSSCGDSSGSCSMQPTDNTTEVLVSEIFPDVPISRIREVAKGCENVTQIVNKMADELSLSVYEKLSLPLQGKQKIRLNINEDYILEDCMAYYKNPAFDPTVPIRIVFEGQPGIDAGGLFRHFYTAVFEEMIDARSSYCLFEGNPLNYYQNLMPKPVYLKYLFM